jgi:EthD domain
VAQYSKVLLTVIFDGDGTSFTKAILDELGALIARGGATNAVLDAPLDGDELDMVGPIANEESFRAMVELYAPTEGGDTFGVSLPDSARVVGAYAVDEVVQKDYVRTWGSGEPSPGVKLLCSISSRPGMPHDDFLAHWRNNHGPLAVKHQPGFWHYVQNHIQEPLTDRTPYLDGIGVLHFREAGDIFTGMYDSEEGQRLIVEDTERFLDNDRNMVLPTKEYLVP